VPHAAQRLGWQVVEAVDHHAVDVQRDADVPMLQQPRQQALVLAVAGKEVALAGEDEEHLARRAFEHEGQVVVVQRRLVLDHRLDHAVAAIEVAVARRTDEVDRFVGREADLHLVLRQLDGHRAGGVKAQRGFGGHRLGRGGSKMARGA
jgi:hypothetical protein